jgi:hypothetical protein
VYAPLSFLRGVTGLLAWRAPIELLPDTGEISRVPVFKFLPGTQAGEVPHRLNMRPRGLDRGRSAPGGLLSPGRGTGVIAPLIAPVIPSGPARYGWCQNKEG